MSNWNSNKYLGLIDLQNDAAKDSLWRSTASLSLRATTKSTGQTSTDRSSFTTKTFSNGNGNGNSSKKKSKGQWKGRNGNGGGKNGTGGSASASDGKSNGKRKVTFSNFSTKENDSWKKARAKLTTEEYYKRRKTKSCINCGEQDHLFADCTKPKP